jgi:hypothetical protein
LLAREVGRISLDESVQLTALVALHDRPRSRRFAARVLQRWLDETPGATIDDALLIAGALAALGGDRHAQALSTLRAHAG